MKYPILSLACLLFSRGVALAQPEGAAYSGPQFHAPSPEAYAALKIDALAHVSNAGASGLSVPLGSVASGPHALSASISYSTGGVKAAEVATYVGLGWSFSLGASLTRVVEGGLPDEKSQHGFLGNPTWARDLTKWVVPGYDVCIGEPHGQYPSPPTDQWGEIDYAPDRFKFSLGGLSGEFRFDLAGEPQFYPHRNVRVERADDLSWFELTDPDGTVYRFGGVDANGQRATSYSSMGYPASDGANQTNTHKDEWHLTEVRDAAGRTVFTVEYRDNLYESEQQAYYWRAEGYVATEAGCPNPSFQPPSGSDDKTGSYFTRAYRSAVVPTRVSAAGLGRYLSFAYANDRLDVGTYGSSADARLRLTSVTEYDGDRAVVRELEQAYAKTDDASAYYEYKLLLEGVKLTAGGSVFAEEAFAYDLTPRGDGTYETVSRLTPYVDAWGYLNSFSERAVSSLDRFNRDAHYILDESVATYLAVDGDPNGLSRRPTVEGSRHAALTSYTDAGGATRAYEFELHQAASYAPAPGTGGENAEQLVEVWTCRTNYADDCSVCTGVTDPTPGYEEVTFAFDPADRYFLEFDLSPPSGSLASPDYEPSGTPDPACTAIDPDQIIEAFVRIERVDNGDLVASATLNLDVLPGGSANSESVLLDVNEFELDNESRVPTSATTLKLSVAVPMSGYAAARILKTEADVAGDVRDADLAVGGLRLAAIELRDGVSGDEALTTYTYEEASGKTSGRLLTYPTFGTRIVMVYGGYVNDNGDLGCPGSATDGAQACRVNLNHYYTNPEASVVNAAGSHISYEKIATEFPESRGRVERSYRAVQSIVPGRAALVSEISRLRSITRPEQGDLLRERFISEGGAIVQEVEFDYDTGPKSSLNCANSTLITRLSSTNCDLIGSNQGIPLLAAFSGTNATVAHELRERVLTRDGHRTTTTHLYHNDDYRLPSTERTVGPDGRGEEVSYAYAYAAADDSDVRNRALASHQLRLTDEVVVSEIVAGTASPSAAYRTEYERFDATGARSSGAGGEVILRPATYSRKGWSQAGATPEEVEEASVSAYNAYGQIAVVRLYDDASDTEYAYDRDRLTSRTFLNETSSATYHGSSRRVATTTSASGQVVAYAYDALGRLEEIRERGGARVTTYDYGRYSEPGSGGKNWRGEVVTVAPSDRSEVTDLATRTYYNALGLPVQTIRVDQMDGGGDIVEDLGYDAIGRLEHRYARRVRFTSGGTSYMPADGELVAIETIAYAEDPLDRVESVTKPLYGSTRTAYGASAGEHGLASGAYRKTVTTDAEGLATAVYEDALGRVVHRVTEATSVRNHYDALGRLDRVYRAWPDQSAAHTIAYGYDAFGRRTAQTIPEEGTRDYVYDDRGRLIAEQGPHERARGFARGFAYDAYGDLEETGKLAALPSDGNAALSFTALISRSTIGRSPGATDFGSPTEVARYTAGGEALREAHTYDVYGRLYETRTYDDARHHGGSSSYSYYRKRQYDHLDNVVRDYQQNVSTEARADMRYQYSAEGYFELVERTVGRDQPYEQIRRLRYDPYGRPVYRELGEGVSSGLVSVQTEYDLQGGLRSVRAGSDVLIGHPAPPVPPDDGPENEVPDEVYETYLSGLSPGGGWAPVAPRSNDPVLAAEIDAAESTYKLAVDVKVLPTDAIGGVISVRARLREGGRSRGTIVSLDTAYTASRSARAPRLPSDKRTFSVLRRAYSAYDLPEIIAELADRADELTIGDSAFDGAVTEVVGRVARELERAHAQDFRLLGAYAPPGDNRPGTRGDDLGQPTGGLVPIDVGPSSPVSKPISRSYSAYLPVFEQHVYRNEGHPYLNAPARGDGRIAYVGTKMLDDPPFDFGYAYDRAHDHALVSAEYIGRTAAGDYVGSGNYNSSYEYAPGPAGLGNLTKLRRRGVQAGATYSDLIDLVYPEYEDASRPGRMTHAGEWSTHGSRGYRPGYIGTALGYDAAGNVTAAGPERLTYDNDAGRANTVTVQGRTTTNLLLRDGSSVGYVDGDGRRHVRYGDIELLDGAPWRIHHEDGYYDLAGERWVWHVRDYLGTPRVTFTDTNGDGTISPDVAQGEILATKTLYPFGMYAFGYTHAGYEASREDFTGHDIVGVEAGDASSRWHGIVDMGARHYSPALGRFLGVDALVDHPHQVHFTPYQYAYNQPANYDDPDGNCPTCLLGAVVGAATDYGLQVATNLAQGQSVGDALSNVDGTSILISAGAGAVSGGLSTVSKLKSAGTLVKLAVEGTVDGATSAVGQYASTGEVSLTEVAADAAGGVIAGRSAGAVGEKIAKSTPGGRAQAARNQRQVRRTGNRAANREQIASNGGRSRPAQAEAADKAKQTAAAQGAGAAVGAGVAGSGVTTNVIDVQTNSEREQSGGQ